MCHVEYHTVCYLRDLLTTPSHKEPEVGAFMTMWNREEFWHGEALAAVLARHGITHPESHVIPSGVDTGLFRPGDKQPGSFLAVGRLIAKKAPDITLRAC